MSRSVLFTCANANQATNAMAVAEHLVADGCACHVMELDAAYHQGAAPVIARSAVASRVTVVHTPEVRWTTPFAELPMRLRWTSVRRVRGELIAAATDHSGVVAGMDGALERCILQRYRRTSRFTAILWDGLVTRQPRVFGPDGASSLADVAWRGRRWLHVAGRRALLRAAGHAGLEPYVPGLAGHASVDTIYTMGRFVTEAFRSQRVRTEIETTGIPRFASLVTPELSRPVERRRAVYLTGSFLWHDERHLDACQQRDLDSLAEALPQGGWHLSIRIHPREDPSRYARFRGQPGVSLSQHSDVPLWDELSRAQVVVTAMSTAGLEALALGRPLLIYLGAFPPGLRDMTLGTHPGIPVATTTPEVIAELARLSGADPTGIRSTLDDFIEPGTQRSAGRIAESIARHLR